MPHAKNETDTSRSRKRCVASCCILFLSSNATVRAAEVPTFDQLAATRHRPLFSPTRRPPPEEKQAPTTDAQRLPPDIVLNAIILGPGVRTALLKRGRDTKALPASTGTDIDGWLVTEIAPNHVILSRSTETITLEFPKRANLPVPLPVGPTRRADITR